MSSDNVEKLKTVVAEEEVELVLEDEAMEDTETTTSSQPGKPDDVIELNSDDEEDDVLVLEPPKKTAFTPEMYRIMEERRRLAAAFFDPESPTSVVNLAPETRTAMGKYAAAMFEWFCCLVSPEQLDEFPNWADPKLHAFPVLPELKRALLRRDLGPRLTDVWRQTKSAEKLANHFKIKVNVAIMSLLDYAVANPTFELDVVPLVQMQHIDKVDYFRVASFMLENCDRRMWLGPQEFLMEALMSPLCASVALYLTCQECVRGAPTAVPWESLERDFKKLPAEQLAEYDEVLLAALAEMDEGDESKDSRDIDRMTKVVEQMQQEIVKQEQKLQKQISVDTAMLNDLAHKYSNVSAERKKAIARAKPADFDEHGADLAKADEDLAVVSVVRKPHTFANQYLHRGDVELKNRDKILARRKEDAPEKFEPATFMDMVKHENEADADKPPTHALVSFDSDPGTVVTVPLSSVATAFPLKGKMPLMTEGLRVAALVHHPLRPREPKAVYSGTIISKYFVQKEEYIVTFDDFFDEFISVNDMNLIISQPFNADTGIFDRRYAYLHVTPSEAVKELSEERQIFILYFLSKYPDWALVRMNDKGVGTNMALKHRNGKEWVAQLLKVDRQLVWLRFNPIHGFDSQPACLAFPCHNHSHEHLDEKMYRGNPRLRNQRTLCNFGRAMELFRQNVGKVDPAQLQQVILTQMYSRVLTAKEARKRQIFKDMASSECAVKSGSDAVEKQEQRTVRSGRGQTARKAGTALQSERAVPMSHDVHVSPEKQQQDQTDPAKTPKKKGPPVRIEHRMVPELKIKDDKFHTTCTHECLKGEDADPSDARFTKANISPYYIPIMCGWRRIKMDYSFMGKELRIGSVHYRAPCGRSLIRMNEVASFLKDTRSELTVDLFTFCFELDETAYVVVNPLHLILSDLTGGSEGRPIPVTNAVDGEAVPPFIYRPVRYPFNQKMAEILGGTTTKEFCSGCDCTDDCADWTKCACQRLTHRESVRTKHTWPVVTKGYTNRLLPEKVGSGIYECNENCGCSRKRCINRVVQNELKVPMEMMRTPSMGWGVRAMADIPRGTFISCYHGALLSDELGEESKDGDEYYADLDFYNLTEIDKENAGIDFITDQGVFFEDVGIRELTLDEVALVEREDELGRFAMLERKSRKAEKRKRERRQDEREREVGRRRAAGGADATAKDDKATIKEEFEDEVKMKKDEGEKGGAEEQVMKVEPESEESEEGGKEGEEERVMKVEPESENEEGEEERGEERVAKEDDDVDEGVEEGDSSASMDEEEEESSHSPSPDEQRMKEKEEEDAKRADQQEKKRREMQRMKRMAEEAAMRFTIPMKDEDGRAQYDMYFVNAECDNLFLLDAKGAGNIGRQYNHSCEPNMYTQHIFVDTHDIRLPWVAFFAKRDIKAGEELCWDYGWTPNEQMPRGLKCQCGAPTCRRDLL